MMLNWTIFCVCVGLFAIGPGESRKHLARKGFTKNQIVPDILDVAPTKSIQIRYLNSGKQVNRGNTLDPNLLKKAPQINYVSRANQFYTLMMVDPDAPSRLHPSHRSVQHWLVVNIPGAALNRGETLTEYLGPQPDPNSGWHRYVFLVYKQSHRIKFDEKYVNRENLGDRSAFSVKDFAAKYKLGKPLAGNFFKANNDAIAVEGPLV